MVSNGDAHTGREGGAIFFEFTLKIIVLIEVEGNDEFLGKVCLRVKISFNNNSFASAK